MHWAADAYDGRLVVCKLNVDENPATRDRYKVQGIPSLLMFKDGALTARHEGAIPQAQLQTFLDANL